MCKRQLDILLGRGELPNLLSGVSTVVCQLLESDLYFQGYCLIKEETLSVKRHLMPWLDSPPTPNGLSVRGQGWVNPLGLGTKCC